MLEFPGRYKALILFHVVGAMKEHCRNMNSVFFDNRSVENFISTFDKEHSKIIETEEGAYYDDVAYSWVCNIRAEIILAVEVVSGQEPVATQQTMLGLLKPYSGFDESIIQYLEDGDVPPFAGIDRDENLIDDSFIVGDTVAVEYEEAPSVQESADTCNEPASKGPCEETMRTKRKAPSYIGVGAWSIMGLGTDREDFNLAVDVVYHGFMEWKKKDPSILKETLEAFDPKTMKLVRKLMKDGNIDRLVWWLWEHSRGNPFKRNFKVSLGHHGEGYYMGDGFAEESLPMASARAAIHAAWDIDPGHKRRCIEALTEFTDRLQIVFNKIKEAGEEGARIGDVMQEVRFDVFRAVDSEAA